VAGEVEEVEVVVVDGVEEGGDEATRLLDAGVVLVTGTVVGFGLAVLPELPLTRFLQSCGAS
jgi:hypothetical protein